MTWSPPDPDTDDAGRARQAIVQAARNRMEQLRAAAPRGTYEHAFLRRDPAGFDAIDLALLDRLTWHYRDRLPAWARPTLNPADPIVRETRDGP